MTDRTTNIGDKGDGAPQSDTPPRADEDITDEELKCLKLEKVAELLDLSKRTVEELVRSGELPSLKVRWNRLVRRSAVLAYIEQAHDPEPWATSRPS